MSGLDKATAVNPDADMSFARNLFSNYGPALLRYLSYRVGNDVDASDLAQEAYLRLIRVKDTELIEKPEAYLFQIAANLASEFHLRKKKTPQTIDLETFSAQGRDGDGDQFQRDMEARSGIQALETLLEDFPPLYRAILLLRKRDGYSHAEIAEKLDLSQHTVHRYLTRALARCRAELVE